MSYSILIADSGSTKTDWVLINGKEKKQYRTIGYNPYFINSKDISESISKELLLFIDPERVKKIYFYGAGSSSPENVAIVEKALSQCFTNSKLFVEHDMLAAARALLGDQPGFAAIIGTGSNTCIYNGKKITKNIESLGYLLGDEGSGSNIGKKLVRNFLRGYLPEKLQIKFYETFRLKQPDILNALYNEPLPNRFLAGFCKFADDNKDNEHIREIVSESFDEFFKNLVTHYPDYKNYEFNCVGSVGFIFADILKETCLAYNMRFGKIIHDPIELLVEFHLREQGI